jgi:hypothetical protein
LLSLTDHHEDQVRKSTSASSDMCCSGAISIDLIRAGARGPLDRGRGAIEYDVVHLGEGTFSIIVGHDYATDREGDTGCGEDQAFDGGSVIAMKGSVRAGLCVPRRRELSPVLDQPASRKLRQLNRNPIITGTATIDILKTDSLFIAISS